MSSSGVWVTCRLAQKSSKWWVVIGIQRLAAYDCNCRLLVDVEELAGSAGPTGKKIHEQERRTPSSGNAELFRPAQKHWNVWPEQVCPQWIELHLCVVVVMRLSVHMRADWWKGIFFGWVCTWRILRKWLTKICISTSSRLSCRQLPQQSTCQRRPRFHHHCMR